MVVGGGVLVAVRVGVGVVVVVSVGASYAPISQIAVPFPSPSTGRATPRWSRLFTGGAAHTLLSPASIAGLPGSRAWVWVGPPLFARGASSGSAPPEKPHELSSTRLWPWSTTVAPTAVAQSPPAGLF